MTQENGYFEKGRLVEYPLGYPKTIEERVVCGDSYVFNKCVVKSEREENEAYQRIALSRTEETPDALVFTTVDGNIMVVWGNLSPSRGEKAQERPTLWQRVKRVFLGGV